MIPTGKFVLNFFCGLRKSDRSTTDKRVCVCVCVWITQIYMRNTRVSICICILHSAHHIKSSITMYNVHWSIALPSRRCTVDRWEKPAYRARTVILDRDNVLLLTFRAFLNVKRHRTCRGRVAILADDTARARGPPFHT